MPELITFHYTEDVSDIRKVKERVVFLYNRFPKTIQSDRHLIDYYLQVFHNVGQDTFYDILIDTLWDNKISFEAITRAGRKLREEHPERYARSDEVKSRIMDKEIAYRRFYTPTFPKKVMV